MKLTTEHFIIVAATIWSVLLPYFPSSVFGLLDSLVGVFFLLLAALLALPYGIVPGVLTLVAVGLTFVERNRRKIQHKILDSSQFEYSKQLEPAPPMNIDEIHPDFDVPHQEEEVFIPTEDATDRFDRVGESIDEKEVIPTISSNTNTAARVFINSHLAKTDLE